MNRVYRVVTKVLLDLFCIALAVGAASFLTRTAPPGGHSPLPPAYVLPNLAAVAALFAATGAWRPGWRRTSIGSLARIAVAAAAGTAVGAAVLLTSGSRVQAAALALQPVLVLLTSGAVRVAVKLTYDHAVSRVSPVVLAPVATSRQPSRGKAVPVARRVRSREKAPTA